MPSSQARSKSCVVGNVKRPSRAIAAIGRPSSRTLLGGSQSPKNTSLNEPILVTLKHRVRNVHRVIVTAMRRPMLCDNASHQRLCDGRIFCSNANHNSADKVTLRCCFPCRHCLQAAFATMDSICPSVLTRHIELLTPGAIDHLPPRW